ncbi:outer membrane protein OmpA-like peptidoglycan-associated protein [Ulvibacter sp. MAR_2010_11]|uniref:OmpA family protein n=1 Tax=Ulvibacter sp. MAR_2010_11 TaxID=1250229 RepID=UPI000C2BB2D6|nr:OmpA family protein [Ulvibacter sp. MAR_2010_11]PKA82786.1 outer membrane protein OmpA-like peptidoglycan-associated protein [Ulvibacter sp. MAR_2010_11]
MKNIYLILLLFTFGAFQVEAQNNDTKKADQLYDRLLYTDAAEAYQKLLKNGKGSRYVFERLANSYYYINDTKKAETFYGRVVKGKKVEAETVYNYAQSLKANGKFSDYNTYMKQFAEMKPSDSRAIEFMKNPDYLPTIMEERPQYEAKNMEEINSTYSEFGGTMLGKEFYFSSARNTTRKKHGMNEEPFLDVYKATDVGGTIKNAELIKGDVNTKFHEGNVAITSDGKRMYFDRNDYHKGDYDKSAEGINQINLYYAENIDGVWKDVQSVAFNSDEYSTGHPALSPDEKTLYFVSDMPGGKGMSDIYSVSIATDGSLGSPVRLSDAINTEGKEVFPYVDNSGNLYFSSDGHLGIGGLDVFVADITKSGFAEPINMGKGVNSSEDDFAFKYNPDTKTGYVSSNRSGGKGSDDIFAIKKLEFCEVMLDMLVINEYTRQPIEGARLDLYDTLENILGSKTTNAEGKSVLTAACDKSHVVQAVAPGYESNALTVEAANDTRISNVLELRPIEAIIVDDKIQLNPILFDLDKHNIKPKAAFELDKLVSLMKKYPNLKIAVESHTDSRASDEYNMDLSERRAQSTVQYVIAQGIDKNRISGKGFGESKPAVSCGDNCSEEQHQKNRRSEFLIIER